MEIGKVERCSALFKCESYPLFILVPHHIKDPAILFPLVIRLPGVPGMLPPPKNHILKCSKNLSKNSTCTSP
jgi:hypothetical protein